MCCSLGYTARIPHPLKPLISPNSLPSSHCTCSYLFYISNKSVITLSERIKIGTYFSEVTVKLASLLFPYLGVVDL